MRRSLSDGKAMIARTVQANQAFAADGGLRDHGPP
jgi:hypothetical protein